MNRTEKASIFEECVKKVRREMNLISQSISFKKSDKIQRTE